MPSTLGEPLPPGSPVANPPYPLPYAPAPALYATPAAAPPYPAPSGTPFDAMLAMQKQMFEMMQAM